MINEQGSIAFAELGLSTQARTLDLFIQGERQVDIAKRLGISPETVEEHLQRARRILNVADTLALGTEVVRRKWVDIDRSGGRVDETDEPRAPAQHNSSSCENSDEDLNRLVRPYGLIVSQ